MLFSDPIFFLFLAFYLLIHFSIPLRYRIHLIIVGSTIFYAYWRVEYVWIPYLLTLIAWAGALWLTGTANLRQRKIRLIISIVLLFLPLAVLKYANFFAHEAGRVLPEIAGNQPWLKYAPPLAVSFVTFTLTAYLVDVYRGQYKRETKLTSLLGYVLFFPHLIAGPILRPKELMPQLNAPKAAISGKFIFGLALFTLGLVKKVVFADTIAGVVDPVFKAGANPAGLEYLLAIYGYSMQIYCDFSGYTDMAIGVAYILGIRLPTNFRRPYASKSILQFWRRWHITLSHWLRDYLYIPLGGNRRGRPRQLANILVTMILGGLWHGANWTFVIWGLLHGIALAIAHSVSGAMARAGLRLPRLLSVMLTFNFVTLAWVCFRSPDIDTAHRVLAGPFVAGLGSIPRFLAANGFELALLTIFLATHRFDQHARVLLLVRRCNRGIILATVALAFLVAITISQGSSAKFIYFDF
ncbi:MAG: MBOAT family protein [Xanthobacteraceae bacterium]